MQNNSPNIQKGLNKIRIINPFNPPNGILDNRQNRTKIFADQQIPLENKFQQQQQPNQPMPFQAIMKEGLNDDIPQENFKLQLAPQQIAEPTIPYKYEQPNNQQNNQLQGGQNEQFQKINFQQKNEQNKDIQVIRLQNKQIGQNPIQQDLGDNQQKYNLIKPQTQPKPIQSKSPIAKQFEPQYPFQNQFQQLKPTNNLTYNQQMEDNKRRDSIKTSESNNQQLNFNQQFEDNKRRESIRTQESYNQQFKPTNQINLNQQNEDSRRGIKTREDDDYSELYKYFNECNNLTKNIYEKKPKTFQEQQMTYNEIYPQNGLSYAPIDQAFKPLLPQSINQQFKRMNPHISDPINQIQQQQYQPDVKQQQIPPNQPLPHFQQFQPHQQIQQQIQVPQIKDPEINQQNNKDLYQYQQPPHLKQQNPQVQLQQQPPQIQPNEIKQQNQQINSIQKKPIQILPPNQPKFKKPQINELQKQQYNKPKSKKNNSDHVSSRKNNIQLLDPREPLIDDLYDQPLERDIFGLKKGQNVNELMNAQKQLGIDQMDDAQLYEYFTQIDINEQKGLSQNIIQEIQTFKIQDEKIEEECSICQENFIKGNDVCSLPCLHIFHSNCIKKCFERFKLCPICRQPVI